MIKIVLTALVAAFLYVAPANASHGVQCAPRDKYVELLTNKYGEQVRVRGILAGGAGVMEIWQNNKGVWSILMTLPNGQSCLIASGGSLEVLKPPLPGKPS